MDLISYRQSGGAKNCCTYDLSAPRNEWISTSFQAGLSSQGGFLMNFPRFLLYFTPLISNISPFMPLVFCWEISMWKGIKGRSSDIRICSLPGDSIRALRLFSVLSSRIRSPSRLRCSVFSISKPRSARVLGSPNNIAHFEHVPFLVAFRQSITPWK